jgi:hypothetical protein
MTPLLEYWIKPGDIVTQTLHITITIQNHTPAQVFAFYRGALNPYNLRCHDRQGGELLWQFVSDQLQIITQGLDTFALQYDIAIGQLAKHGHQGRLTTDFLTCSGGNVLLLPLALASSETDEAVRKSVTAIRLFFDVPPDWIGIVPFTPTPLLVPKTIVVSNPGWADIHAVLKSAYTWGRFTRSPFVANSELTIFAPSAASSLHIPQIHESIRHIYEYYAGLFGIHPQLALVLLQTDCRNGNYIFGGAGKQTISTTFQPECGRDWELLAHRLFHAFFDARERSSHYYQAPQNWFYEGLATYYENVAVAVLPPALKVRLDLDGQNKFFILFQRYLYFRLRVSHLLALVPMEEARIRSGGMLEFLHYTQAPLLIKLLEDTSFNETHRHDRILQFLLDNRSCALTVPQILREVLGANMARKIEPFLSSTAVLPLWYLQPANSQDHTEICRHLDDYSQTLWSWFRQDGIHYRRERRGVSNITSQK